MKSVLITGCNGYIGKVLAKHVKRKYPDCTVIGVDHDPSKNANKYVDFLHFCDVQDTAFLDACKTYEVENVFHLAALANVPDSFRAPASYYFYNSAQTISLFHNLLRIGWRGKFVFSSTAGIYGRTNELINEDASLSPPHPYGRSKLIAESVLEELSHAYNIPTCVFRYFNVIGADEDCGDHLTSSHVLQRLCHAAYYDEPFNVYGTDLEDTPDGTCVRDYIDVQDICEAHMRAVETPLPSLHNTYNLGTSNGLSVKRLKEIFEKVTGKTIVVHAQPPRPGDPSHLVADGSLFAKEMNFDYNDHLEGIIESAWNYYQQKAGENNAV